MSEEGKGTGFRVTSQLPRNNSCVMSAQKYIFDLTKFKRDYMIFTKRSRSLA